MIAALLFALVTGVVVNELYDWAGWCARKLVRWSAFRQYADQARAAARAEELEAVISDRPGSLLRLITAMGFVGGAVMAAARRALSAQRQRHGHPNQVAIGIDQAPTTPVHGNGLSPRMREILKFINAYGERYCCAPSQREIATAVGYQGLGGLHYQLSELKRLGYLEYEPNKPRTIRVLPSVE